MYDPVTFWHANRDSDYIPLYSCSRCGAVTTLDDRQTHEQWHLYSNKEN